MVGLLEWLACAFLRWSWYSDEDCQAAEYIYIYNKVQCFCSPLASLLLKVLLLGLIICFHCSHLPALINA